MSYSHIKPLKEKKMKTFKLYGPPGTGKTYSLLRRVKKYLAIGVPPARIGYFAFTRNAAYKEARDPLLEEMPSLQKKDLKYFQTLHSFAFQRLGLKKENVMQEEHFRAIGESIGVEIEYASYEKDSFNGIFTSESEYLNIVNLAKVKGITPLEQFDLNEHLGEIERTKVDIISQEIESYKKHHDLIDFTDMLKLFLNKKAKEGNPIDLCPDFDVVFIDEAQDLSKIQWKVVKRLQKHCKYMYLAGDDDQAIFGWAGADVKSFMDFESKEKYLRQSRRLPEKIQKKALEVIERIQLGRKKKSYHSKNEEGNIIPQDSLEEINMRKGKWLILARTNSLLDTIFPLLKDYGYYFSSSQGNSLSASLYRDILDWERWIKGEPLNLIQAQRICETRIGIDFKEKENRPFYIKELLTKYNLGLITWYKAFSQVSADKCTYIRSMLINGEKLSEEPRIRVLTIHGAKGGEEDNVVLFQDQTVNTLEALDRSLAKYDEEQRVWYVGITRTKHNLYLIKGKNDRKEFII